MAEDNEKNNSAGVVAALLSVYIIWGSTYLAIRIALESFPPFFMSGIRFFIIGLALYLFLRVRGQKAPEPAQWKGSAVMGALLLLGGNGGVVYAEQWVSSGLAALSVATVPLWTALFGGLWKRWPTRVEWAGIIIGFAGVGLLSLEGGMRAHPAGALALLLAAISWSFGSAWSSSLKLPSGLMASAAQMFLGGSFLLAVSFISGENLSGAFSARSLWAQLYLMIFGSLIGFSSYIYLLNRARPALATSYAFVNPAVAMGLGVWLAAESITSIGAAALVTIIIAVALVIFGQRR